MADLDIIRQVKNKHEKEWMARKEVVAVGIGKTDGETGIIISVSAKSDKLRVEIEEQIEGVPVKIQQTGEFKAQ
jgi:hypothetical protein